MNKALELLTSDEDMFIEKMAKEIIPKWEATKSEMKEANKALELKNRFLLLELAKEKERRLETELQVLSRITH